MVKEPAMKLMIKMAVVILGCFLVFCAMKQTPEEQQAQAQNQAAEMQAKRQAELQARPGRRSGLVGGALLIPAPATAPPPQPTPRPQPLIESGSAMDYPAQCPAAGARTSLAVYPVKPAGADTSLASAMTALLSSKLSPSPRLRVIEEAMLKVVMERQGLNVSDACDSTVCQVEIGKLVQAQKLVTGDLAKFGSKYILSLKVVDILTGAMEFATEDSCSCSEDQLDKLVTVAAAKVRNHFCDAVPLPNYSR
jgi:hypothetical protein